MYCSNCGFQIDKEAKFCVSCGYNSGLKETSDKVVIVENPVDSQNRKRNMKIAVAASLAIILLILVYYWINKPTTETMGGTSTIFVEAVLDGNEQALKSINKSNYSEREIINTLGPLLAGKSIDNFTFTPFVDYDLHYSAMAPGVALEIELVQIGENYFFKDVVVKQYH